jgi:hypothetical protein
LSFIFGTVDLPPHHILDYAEPLWVTIHASKILQYEGGRHQKGKKLIESSSNGS